MKAKVRPILLGVLTLSIVTSTARFGSADPTHRSFESALAKNHALVKASEGVQGCAFQLAQSLKESMVSPNHWTLDCSPQDRESYGRALFSSYDFNVHAIHVQNLATYLLECPASAYPAEYEKIRHAWHQALYPQLERVNRNVLNLQKGKHINPLVYGDRLEKARSQLGRLHELTADLGAVLDTRISPVIRHYEKPVPKKPIQAIQDEHGEIIYPFWTGQSHRGQDLRVRMLVSQKSSQNYQSIGVQIVQANLKLDPSGRPRSVARLELYKNNRKIWERRFDRNELYNGSNNVANTPDYPQNPVERIAGPNLALRSTGEPYVSYSKILVRHNPRTERGSVILRLFDDRNRLIDSWVTDFPNKASAVW